MAPLLAGDERAMLIVEYQGSADEARAGLGRLRALADDLGAVRLEWLDDPAALAEAGALRRAVTAAAHGRPRRRAAGRLRRRHGGGAGAPRRTSWPSSRRLVAAEGARASFTGHASAGCMHVRPLLDLKSAAGVRHMETLAAAVGRLVAEYHGAISGEHGVGRSRSWALPGLLGPDLYAAMVALKDAFDPRRLLGPGTIVDGPAVAESLRYGADYRGDGAWAPRLSYAAEGGFDLAVEKCFGAGLCKKLTGTMCPPAAVCSQRGALDARQGQRSAGRRSAAPSRWRPSAPTSFATCSARASPARPARRSARPAWTWPPSRSSGSPSFAPGTACRPWRAASASFAGSRPLRRRSRRSSTPSRGRAPRASGHRSRWVSPIERPLPAFSRRPLTSRLAGAPARAGAALFVDCFVQYQEPQVGEALAGLLRAAGVELALVDAGCCGRTALSTGQIDKARAAAATALAALHAARRGRQ